LFDDLGEEDELPFFNFRRFIKSTGENSHLPKLEQQPLHLLLEILLRISGFGETAGAVT
jgi:hypothetical protein